MNRLESGQTKKLFPMDFEQLHWIYNNILKPIYVDYRNAKKGLPNLIY